MPYAGQRAAKTGHASFFEAELDAFLQNCHYLKTLNADEHALVETFKVHVDPETMSRQWLWASDGSRYIASVQDGAPTTRIGYIKVSHVGFAWNDFVELLPNSRRYVDPLAVARLREAVKTVVWMLPGSNVQYKTAATSRESFRLRLHELFQSTRVSDEAKPLYNTLFQLRAFARNRPQDKEQMNIRECPECHHRHSGEGLCFTPEHSELPCSYCGNAIYASDVLGFHQEYEEHGANDGLFTRVMSVLEALMLAQRWDCTEEDDSFVADTIFFYDGLLGLYGEAAWLCRGLLVAYHDVKLRLVASGKRPPLVVGVAKTGQLMHHAEAILGDLAANDVVPLSLQYRRSLLRHSVDNPQRPFFQSRWGQDFIWRTGQGQPVVLSIPFWTSDFESHKETIHRVENYPELPEILGALNSMDCALFPSAFIPVVLAHEEASIAWEPGGRLLTEATKRALLAASHGHD